MKGISEQSVVKAIEIILTTFGVLEPCPIALQLGTALSPCCAALFCAEPAPTSAKSALVAMSGAILAYRDYSEKAKIQALSELHAEQLSVCQDVAESSAQLFDARTQQDFDKALDRFTSLKHGKALVVLSPSVIKKMLEAYNLAINLKLGGNEDENRSNISKELVQ